MPMNRGTMHRILLHWKMLVVPAALVVAVLAVGPESTVRSALATGTSVRTVRVTGSGNRDASVADTTAARFARRYGIARSLATLIHDHSVSMGVEPALVFGLISTESGFDPRAVGQQGAVGLMQIKPSTARAYDRRVTREQLLRPDVNVRLGLRHLIEEVEYFDRDWKLGLLAYNMGRTRLSRALERGHLPRNPYAAKVLAHCDELCS